MKTCGSGRHFAAARRTVLTMVIAGEALLSACGGPSFPGDLTWESEHFVYKAREGESNACRDILEPLEKHFLLMQETLGLSWPAGRRVTYYKFLDPSDLREHSECGDAAACTNGSAVQTEQAFNGHELVHAYLAPTGFPPWMLVEGTAVALSCQLTLYPRPTGDWRDVYGLGNSGPRSSELYGAGGWLAGFLLRTQPAASFIQLYGQATHEMGAAGFATLFEQIYGQSLDSVWTEVTKQERPPIICPWQCSLPAWQPDGLTAVPASTVCGVGGGYTLELPAPGDLVVSAAGNASFSLGSCGDGPVPPATFWSASSGAGYGAYRVGTGRYFFGAPASGGTLLLSLFPAESWITSGCVTPAEPPPWANLRGSLYLALPAGTWQVPLSWSPARPVVAYPTLPSTPAQAQMCPACDGTAGECAPFSQASPFSATISGARTIRVTSSPAPGGAEFAEITVLAP